MKQYVLFDLDGTLTDSAPGITLSLAHAVRTIGGDPPETALLRSFIGTPLREIFRELVPDAGGEHIEQAVVAYRDRFDRVGIRENSVFPGVARALASLRDDGCSLFVATSKGQDTAEQVLELFDLRLHFDGVFGVRPQAGITSKLDVLRAAIDSARIPSPSATMVGDRHYDIDAACEAGVRGVGVAWGYASAGELASAHAVVETPSELVELIRAAV